MICLRYASFKKNNTIAYCTYVLFLLVMHTSNVTSPGWRDRGDMSSGAGHMCIHSLMNVFSLYYKLSKYCTQHNTTVFCASTTIIRMRSDSYSNLANVILYSTQHSCWRWRDPGPWRHRSCLVDIDCWQLAWRGRGDISRRRMTTEDRGIQSLPPGF
jgi:hypothetical protein